MTIKDGFKIAAGIICSAFTGGVVSGATYVVALETFFKGAGGDTLSGLLLLAPLFAVPGLIAGAYTGYRVARRRAGKFKPFSI